MPTTVDSLRIEITTSASKAEKKLDDLVNKINTLARTVGNLGGAKFDAGKLVSGPQKLADGFKNAVKNLNTFQEKFQDAGKNIHFNGTLSQFQKEITKTESKLERLWNLQDKKQALGINTDSQSWKSLQYDISRTENILQNLYTDFERLRSETQFDFSGIRNLESSMNTISDRMAELSKTAEVSVDAVKYNASAMQQVFGKSAAGIESYSDAVQKFGTGASAVLNELGNAGKADPFLSIRKSLLSMQIDLGNLSEKLKTAKIYIQKEDFEALSKQIDNASRNVEKLWNRQELSDALGVKATSREFKTLSFNISKAEENVRSLSSQLNRMTTSGLTTSPLTVSASTPKVKTASFTQESAAPAIQETAKAAQKSTGKITNLSNAFKKLQKFGAQAGKILRNVASVFSRMGMAVAGLIKKIFGVSSGTERYHRSMGKMLARAMLFRTVFRSLSAITSGYTESINSLVQVDSRLNAGMTKLTSSILFLRNAFSAMTAPLISVVAPAFEYISGKMSELANRAGQFIAALTGQDTYTKAVYVQNDYAKSLDESSSSTKNLSKSTKDAVKEAKRGIASFDELEIMQRNLSDTADDLSDSIPESTEILPQDMFKTVPVESSMKAFADRFKKLFSSGQWAKLGASAAKGLNAGLQKLYNALKSNKVAKKINEMTDAVTQAFNSFVAALNWNLLGRTAGAAINDIVSVLNQLIEKTHWKMLGRKIADAINGLFDEVNWEGIGNFFGNKFMILWKTISGIVEELNFPSIGISFAELLNGAFEKISFSDIASTLTRLINGAFVSLKNFTATFKWDELADNVVSGLNTAFSTLKWEDAGKSLEEFLDNLDEFMLRAASGTKWEEFGKGIGKFLSEIDWDQHLTALFNTLKTVLEGIWDGLGNTSAGKFVQAIVAFNIGAKLFPFVLKIASFFKGESAVNALSSGIMAMIGKAFGVAAAALGGFELGKYISVKFLDGEDTSAPDFVKNYIFGYEPGDISGAIDQFLQDMAAKVHPLTDSDISFYETSENSILSLLKGGSIDGTNASALLSFLSKLKSASEDSELAILELQNKFNELGIPDDVFEEFKRLTEGLPESIRGVKTEVETNIVGAQEVITSSTKKAAQDANKNLTSIKDDAESTSGKVSETVGTNWSSSKGSVVDALSAMKGETSQKMREIYANVQSYTNSIWNITANNWDAIAKKVSLVLSEMVTNTRKSANQIASLMSSMSLRIKYSLNGLYNIGYNAIIGLNNGMVKASDKLFENVQRIAQNVPKIFKSAWKIHSPSKLMENIMDMNIQGLIVSAENMSPKLYSVMGNIAAYMDDIIPRLQSDIGNISVNMQTDTRMIMPKASSEMSNNGFGDDIRREIMAISSNTFNSNENVGPAVRSVLNGMAVYADDKIVGYLRDKDNEWRNQNGRGIFET